MGDGEGIYISKIDGQCHGDRQNGDPPPTPKQGGGGDEGRESRIGNRETESRRWTSSSFFRTDDYPAGASGPGHVMNCPGSEGA